MSTWVDRVYIVLSRYIFNYQNDLLKLALTVSKKIYPMLNMRSGIKETLDLSVHHKEYHVYDTFLNKYIASVYGYEFEKLWRFLHCGYRTFSIFTKCLCKDDGNYMGDNEMYNSLILAEGSGDYYVKSIPLLIPLKLMYTKPVNWSNECMSAQLIYQSYKDKDVNYNIAQSVIIKLLRKKRFIALHNNKGNILTAFYMMPNVTIYNELISLTSQVIFEPILSDLYLNVIFNSNGQLSNITKEIIDIVIKDIYNSIYNNLHNDIYIRLLRYISAYCNVHVEQLFGIKKYNVISKVSDKLLNIFHINKNSGKININNNHNSGGICGHPKWPIYAIVYGNNIDNDIPAYSVTLQHSAILAKACNFSTDNLNIQCNNYIKNNTYDTVFGDITTINWSGDYIAVYDKNGWLLIYHMKNLLYLECDLNNITIPTISFKTHNKASFITWLGEYIIITLGDGICNATINNDLILCDVSNKNLHKKLQPKRIISIKTSDTFITKFSSSEGVSSTSFSTDGLNLQNSNSHNSLHDTNKNKYSEYYHNNDVTNLSSTRGPPPEVTTLSSTRGRLADSSSNYLSLKSNATPGDRGEGSDGSSIMGMMEDGSKDVLDVTSSGMKCSTRPQMEPGADLREAKGEVNKGGRLQDKERTSGGTASGKTSSRRMDDIDSIMNRRLSMDEVNNMLSKRSTMEMMGISSGDMSMGCDTYTDDDLLMNKRESMTYTLEYIQSVIKSINEYNVPCICIWDLVDYNKNNIPKLKAIILDTVQIPHTLFNKKKHHNYIKFTCILPLYLSDYVYDDFDLMIFDSIGIARIFSYVEGNILLTVQLHDTCIIKGFQLNNNKILTIDDNGKICIWLLNGYKNPIKLMNYIVI